VGLEELEELEELWISNNQISSFDQIKSQLENKKNLSTVYLEGNPVQAENDAGYRLKLLNILPRLKQIDATVVRDS
jgi:Leucine-rich repeat (LRR) protein